MPTLKAGQGREGLYREVEPLFDIIEHAPGVLRILGVIFVTALAFQGIIAVAS